MNITQRIYELEKRIKPKVDNRQTMLVKFIGSEPDNSSDDMAGVKALLFNKDGMHKLTAEQLKEL